MSKPLTSQLLPQPSSLQWSDDEVLPLQEPQSHGRSAPSRTLRATVQLMLLLVLLPTLTAGLCAAAITSGASGGKGKDEGFVLPFHC
mmetsp:Transcript_134489/g.374820  ORF Transcript_134489/g.374820 Transcript_134489/m.374820 type:complete len:87 (-) Transcript_134489:59-319(-)